MKNINLVDLPNFHGLSTEDPNTFLFEFEVVCQTYDHLVYVQNLKPFPSTLKDSSLGWFMNLEDNSVVSLEKMKETFMDKYRDYCKSKTTRDEIFRMEQGENESLEYF